MPTAKSRRLTHGDILIAVILTVKITITKPRSVDTLMNQHARELRVAAAVARHVVIVAALLVRHVQTVIVTVTRPRRLNTPPVGTAELWLGIACYGSYKSTTHKPICTTVTCRIIIEPSEIAEAGSFPDWMHLTSSSQQYQTSQGANNHYFTADYD